MDEAFGHIRQLSLPDEGPKSPLPEIAIIQMLVLSVRENLHRAVAAELGRMRAHLEPRGNEAFLGVACKAISHFRPNAIPTAIL